MISSPHGDTGALPVIVSLRYRLLLQERINLVLDLPSGRIAIPDIPVFKASPRADHHELIRIIYPSRDGYLMSNGYSTMADKVLDSVTKCMK